MRTLHILLPLLALLITTTASADELKLDGVPNEALWQEAKSFDDFRVTDPYTLTQPTHPTRALLRSLPDGIAVAFIAEQPNGTPRLKPRAARDAQVNADRVNFSIDFDGDGRIAYNFMVTLGNAIGDEVISNENNFNGDWDGLWDYALHEDPNRWSVEMLIPWSVASMSQSSAATRTIGVHFDRVIASHSERSADAAVHWERPRYVSEFTRVEVENHAGKGLLSIVPYASISHDAVSGQGDQRAGLDLFWKPSGHFQLSATLNPDFGQVEADDLVVDFSAIEVFFSDKRPFFTENQAIFDFRLPDSGRLVYTRRMGGPSDVDGSASDIDAGIKLNGSAGGFDYGTLAVLESDHADDVGRAYFAQRLQRDFGTLSLGWLTTWADRPFLERSALVNAIDATWRPNPQWLLSAQALASTIDTDGQKSGNGAWLRAFYSPNQNWQNELEATHYDRDLNFNDVGYQRRNNYNELEWTTTRRFSGFADDFWIRSADVSIEPQLRWNDRGDRLPPTLLSSTVINLRSGGELEAALSFSGRGYDDLISRGNGLVVQEPRLQNLALSYSSPRIGRWAWNAGAGIWQAGNEDFTYTLDTGVRFFARDDLDLGLSFNPNGSRDWLLWREGTLFASYHRRERQLELDANWFPGRRHELRMKLQWLGLVADAPTPYRIGDGGHLVQSDDVVDPFAVNQFGVQLRYRYEFGPRRELYVVYARGGNFAEAFGPDADQVFPGLGNLYGDIPDLRDADQVLVKLRWEL